MAVVALGLPPSEVRQMTIDEINACFKVKVDSRRGAGLTGENCEELYADLMAAREEESGAN